MTDPIREAAEARAGKSDEELKRIALTMIFILYGPRALKVLGYEVPR
jgi:hypothetical protein